MKSKTIKILYSTRTRRDTRSIHAGATRYIETPKISIEGKWLEALGYHIGGHVRLEYDESGIHIRPLTAAEQEAMECRQAQAELERRTIELRELKSRMQAENPAPSMVAEPKPPYLAPPTSE